MINYELVKEVELKFKLHAKSQMVHVSQDMGLTKCFEIRGRQDV